MKNKKGFTLIEILAVMVILAIISLIAIPVILNIINDSKADGVLKSTKLYVSTVEKYLINERAKGQKVYDGYYMIYKNGILKNIQIQMNGKMPTDGWVKIKQGDVEKGLLKYDDICVMIDENGKTTVSKKCSKLNLPVMKMALADDFENREFLGSTIVTRDKIETITFKDEIEDNLPNSMDVSEKADGSVILWYKDEDKNGLYEVYIGGDGGVEAPKNCTWLFVNLTAIKKIDFTYLNTSNVEDMSQMFSGCKNITSFNLSILDTTKVTAMDYMFANCTSLKDLNLNGWNTSNVANMDYMFLGDTNLKNLDISSFDLTKLKSTIDMFKDVNNTTIKANSQIQFKLKQLCPTCNVIY